MNPETLRTPRFFEAPEALWSLRYPLDSAGPFKAALGLLDPQDSSWALRVQKKLWFNTLSAPYFYPDPTFSLLSTWRIPAPCPMAISRVRWKESFIRDPL